MSNTFKKVHQTASRVRYRFNLLKEEFIDDNILSSYLSKIKGVNKVRVNKKASSIIFNIEDTEVCYEIETILDKLSLDDLLNDGSYNSLSLAYVKEDAPTLNGVIRASSALISERFISNDFLKASLTIGAAAPMLIDGTKELFSEGLTSKVLESAAVAVSVFRKDYLAANSTNAMFELGEYI